MNQPFVYKPTADEIVRELRALRNTSFGIRLVWVCCTETGWFVTVDRKGLRGLYARTTLGAADFDVVIDIAAEVLLEKIQKTTWSARLGEWFSA